VIVLGDLGVALIQICDVLIEAILVYFVLIKYDLGLLPGGGVEKGG
jgi:hypothetical protein